MNLEDDGEKNGNEEREPQVTSSDPHERKLARRLRIERRLETLRKSNMPEGEEEKDETTKKTLLQEQLQKSYDLLQRLTVETMHSITNVRVANESREINRREIEDINRDKILEYLDNEAKIAEEHFNVIDEKWLKIFNYNDPLRINEEILSQKEKCDALIKKKDAVIAKLKNEVNVAELKFADDQKKQLEDIQVLTERIENQLVLMRRAYDQEFEVIEDVLMMERKILLETTNKRWEDLHKKRDLEEQLNSDEKFEQLEEFEEICKKLRVDHQEKYREIQIQMGNNIENLQCELEKIKSIALMNCEKLDYNYQVLKKREAENLLIRSQQKRKMNKLQDTINNLKTKIRNYTEKANEKIEKLTLDVHKLRASVLDIEDKADSFCKVSDVKYQQVWDFNREEVESVLQQVLDIDRILHEQQLGLKWEHPECILLNKIDLPSYKSALEVVSEVRNKRSEDTQTLSSVEESSKESHKETVAHRRILRIILKLIADKTGFLIEDKLKEVLKPYSEDDQSLVKVDCVFAALEIKEARDIDILFMYFLPYTHCPICMQSSVSIMEGSETLIKTYDLSNESEDTSEVQLEVHDLQEPGLSNILSAVHQPHEVIEEIVSNISHNAPVSLPQSMIKKPTVTVSILEEPDKCSKVSKVKPVQSVKTSCHNKHPLLISSIYVLRALREFLSNFYTNKEFIVTMQSRMSRKRSTISRLMLDIDVQMYWDRFRKMFSSDREEIWDALYMGLGKYYAILTDRKKLNDEVIELRRQHSELGCLLACYEKDAKKKMKPPCGQ